MDLSHGFSPIEKSGSLVIKSNGINIHDIEPEGINKSYSPMTKAVSE